MGHCETETTSRHKKGSWKMKKRFYISLHSNDASTFLSVFMLLLLYTFIITCCKMYYPKREKYHNLVGIPLNLHTPAKKSIRNELWTYLWACLFSISLTLPSLTVGNYLNYLHQSQTGLYIFLYYNILLHIFINASTSDINESNKSLKPNSKEPEWSFLCELEQQLLGQM